MPRVFIPRVPELLALEGWYGEGRDRFKLSCRFSDILRCSTFNGKSVHFVSCFRNEPLPGRGLPLLGERRRQPTLRCYDPTWGIIYRPDKHGNFVGRVFVRWGLSMHTATDLSSVVVPGTLVIGKVYGSLSVSNIIEIFKVNNLLNCLHDPIDTFLPES